MFHNDRPNGGVVRRGYQERSEEDWGYRDMAQIEMGVGKDVGGLHNGRRSRHRREQKKAQSFKITWRSQVNR